MHGSTLLQQRLELMNNDASIDAWLTNLRMKMVLDYTPILLGKDCKIFVQGKNINAPILQFDWSLLPGEDSDRQAMVSKAHRCSSPFDGIKLKL